MGDISTLLGAIGTLITAVGGAIGVVVTAIRSGNRQAKAAAEKAASEIDDEQSKKIAELEAQLRKLAQGEP
ncbi:hypothetical protein [Saccharopolyspora pogona]|uniref:hypothetical protein n=1 Tax=Saccharopolyspora pogona TaxID=333966 RepID=UPI0016832D51|nr:hypothetical protein [Saccharopolyspora pogona]